MSGVDYKAPKYPRIKFENDARRKLTKQDIEEAKSLITSGWTYKRAGEYLGVSGTTIHYHTDPEWAKQVNQKRYQSLKKQLAEMSPKERQARFYLQNQRFLERTKTDPLAREFKAKHTYKWKKSKLGANPEFKEKTNRQALEKYHRDMKTQPEKLRERRRKARLKRRLIQ